LKKTKLKHYFFPSGIYGLQQKSKYSFYQLEKCHCIRVEKFNAGVKPKKLIHEISESLLDAFGSLRLIDNYDVYQHLMLYWSEVMQDDVYVISDDGWKAGAKCTA
jgi:type I restriction enzyme M protein